jgi:hypothetical protein
MSTPEPSEDELRAAYEAELKRITVAEVVLQTVVSLINLAGRRLGLAAGAEDERDPEQARDAIDAVRGLLPVVERQPGAQLGPIRDALSQLQLAYAKESGSAAKGEGGEPGSGGRSSGGRDPNGEGSGAEPAPKGPAKPKEGAGPAQSSGRLWVPGQ